MMLIRDFLTASPFPLPPPYHRKKKRRQMKEQKRERRSYPLKSTLVRREGGEGGEKGQKRGTKKERKTDLPPFFLAVGGATQETPSRNKSASAKRRAMEKEAKEQERKEETWELMKHTFLDEGSLHGNSRVSLDKKEKKRIIKIRKKN